jgi:hypothetical protein
LVLIDQHAAHERIRLEDLNKGMVKWNATYKVVYCEFIIILVYCQFIIIHDMQIFVDFVDSIKPRD